MSIRHLLVLSLLLSSRLYADENPGRPKILFLNQNINTKELTGNYDLEKPEGPTNVMPDLAERDSFFSGINFPASWDDLNKDIFYVEIHQRPLSYLIKKYPEIKKEDIARLKENKK
jgi:hypothetical protein